MKALVGAFNQEKALVGAFSVITNLRMELFEALDTGDTGVCDALCWNRLLQFWIEGVAVPVIAGLGIIGNIFCLFVLNHKCVDLKASFSNLLKCLCVFDILILVRNS